VVGERERRVKGKDGRRKERRGGRKKRRKRDEGN
jgi:hypothetical protein